MLKIALVGCSASYAETIKNYITEFCYDRSLLASVRCCADGEVLLADYFVPYDIVIIDVDGNKSDGMGFAEKFRKIDARASVIIISAHVMRAIDGYSVGACGFVLIPIEPERFFESMDRAVFCMPHRNDAIILKSVNSIVNICASHIYYIESNAHYLTYHTAKGDFVVRELMRTAEQNLKPFGFVRINHGYIVNIEYVQSVKGEMTEITGIELKISRSRKAEFILRLEEFRKNQCGASICGADVVVG